MIPKKNRGAFTYIVIALILIFVITFSLGNLSQKPNKVSYNEIMTYFDEYKVTEYTFDIGTGELVMKVKGQDKPINYRVPNINLFLSETQSQTNNYRREYNEQNPDEPLKQDYYREKNSNFLFTVLPTILLLLMGLSLFFFMMKQAGGGSKYSSFGKASVKSQSQNGKKTTFADVAGLKKKKKNFKK